MITVTTAEHVKMGDRLAFGVVVGYHLEGSGHGRRDRVTLVTRDDRRAEREIEYETGDLVMVERVSDDR